MEKSGLILMPPGVLGRGIGAHATIKQGYVGTSHERDEKAARNYTADVSPPGHLVPPVNQAP